MASPSLLLPASDLVVGGQRTVVRATFRVSEGRAPSQGFRPSGSLGPTDFGEESTRLPTDVIFASDAVAPGEAETSILAGDDQLRTGDK